MKAISYKDSGVDIEAGNKLVDRIKPLAKATATAGVAGGIGGFGAVFDLAATGFKDPLLISSTDGVGTKLKLAFHSGIHNSIGIDLVAMCVNDLVVQGAKPLFFLDYFATGKLSIDIAEQVISGIAEGCKLAGCALVGGETAEMPGMYSEGEYDLAGFSVGAVERENLLPKPGIKAGDKLIAIASSGLHSNGYSLVRKLLEINNINIADHAEKLLTPTRIYVKSCLSLLGVVEVKAFCHITGGGLSENIPRILPDEVGAQINLSSWQIPELFTWLQKLGNIEEAELFRTLNCGVGMVCIVSEENVDKALDNLKNNGEKAWVIGNLHSGNNIVSFVKE
jgi:phosphoribosylformylglycinamidine cyclo-ligase